MLQASAPIQCLPDGFIGDTYKEETSMSKPNHTEILNTLLQQHGQTFAAEIGIPIQNDPSSVTRIIQVHPRWW
jgi:hypothetical protein